jgi:hypothetical protein
MVMVKTHAYWDEKLCEWVTCARCLMASLHMCIILHTQHFYYKNHDETEWPVLLLTVRQKTITFPVSFNDKCSHDNGTNKLVQTVFKIKDNCTLKYV